MSGTSEAGALKPTLQARSLIRDVPDFPQSGIVFKDITPVLKSPEAFGEIVAAIADYGRDFAPDLVIGIESRGFVFGAPVALALGAGFVPVRKKGKLPHITLYEEYALEYGVNTVEIHIDAICAGQSVLIVDDLLATGGTAHAAAKLVERLGGIVAAFVFVIELGFLDGRAALAGYPVKTLIQY